MRNVLTLILAGGKGTRLDPLTRERAKPAVPFGGAYRILDFTLSNCLNSDLRRVLVLPLYRAASLDRHIHLGWGFLHRELDELIEVLPPQQRIDEQWHQGTADAVYQNIYTIEQHPADYLLILSGDHIYKMDYADMIRRHIEANAVATIACLPVELQYSDQFGALQVDDKMRVTGFLEKPPKPTPMPDDPSRFLASMGIYVFNRDFLLDRLCDDATDRDSSHDFGKDIIPQLIDSHPVLAHPFRDRNTGRPTTGGTSGHSMLITKRTWTSSRSTRSLTSMTDPGQSTPTTRPCHRRRRSSPISTQRNRESDRLSTVSSAWSRSFREAESNTPFSAGR